MLSIIAKSSSSTAWLALTKNRLGLRLLASKYHNTSTSTSTSITSRALPTAPSWQLGLANLDTKQVEFYHKEMLIRVDEEDRVLGAISKGEAHTIDVVRKSVYHRALSLLVFDEQDRFLLTQRASCKITFPDYFTNACCSHPLYEEAELEQDGDAIGVKRAAIRRLSYELGSCIQDVRPSDLKFVNKLAYRAESDGGQWGEAEIDYIFVLHKNLKLEPNPEEVQSLRFVSRQEMADILSQTGDSAMKITPWVKLLARDYLFTYWDNLHQLDKIAQTKTIVHNKELLMSS